MRASVEQRFAAKYIVLDSGCWQWVGATTGTSNGMPYGRFRPPSQRAVMAHRWSYEAAVGPIPGGMQIDHLCRNTLCVNPAHLEPVVPRENIIRGTSPNASNAAKTHCIRGHELTQENCYTTKWPWNRECKLCARLASRAKYALVRAKRAALR